MEGHTEAAALAASPEHAGSSRVLLRVSALRSNDYDVRTQEVRTQTWDLAAATLVSSRLYARVHAPALDLDFPAALSVDAGGAQTLWVDAPLRPFWFRRFLKVAAKAGLAFGPVPSRRELAAPTRAAAFAAAAPRVLDTGAVSTVLARAGATLGATLEECFATATAVVAGPDGEVPFASTPPTMTNPWPVRLAVPATLVRSTHHHHLYLQAELWWPAYVAVLRAARRADLLEAGYVQASVARRASDLRLPWVTKEDEPPF